MHSTPLGHERIALCLLSFFVFTLLPFSIKMHDATANVHISRQQFAYHRLVDNETTKGIERPNRRYSIDDRNKML